MLRSEAALTQAALLLEERVRSIFSPVAVYGFDTTTVRRLRIPVDEAEGEHMPKEPWTLPAESREVLRPYFSVREFDEHPNIGFVPFRSGDRTQAILLFTGEGTKEYVDYFSSRREEIARLLSQSRPDFRPDSRLVTADDAFSATDRELKKADNEQRTLLFLYLDYSALLRSLTALCSAADPYFLYLELVRLTAHYFRNSGTTVTAGRNTCIVIQESKRAKKGRLLVHQLLRHLDGYFSADIQLPEPAFQQKHYPGEGNTAEEFLEGYL